MSLKGLAFNDAQILMMLGSPMRRAAWTEGTWITGRDGFTMFFKDQAMCAVVMDTEDLDANDWEVHVNA